jgi:pilus assembly protein Flp/PilA
MTQPPEHWRTKKTWGHVAFAATAAAPTHRIKLHPESSHHMNTEIPVGLSGDRFCLMTVDGPSVCSPPNLSHVRSVPAETTLNGPGQGGVMLKMFVAFLLDESGQDLAEYAILIGLIALAVLLAVTLLGTTISNIFSDIGTTLSGAGIPGGGS